MKWKKKKKRRRWDLTEYTGFEEVTRVRQDAKDTRTIWKWTGWGFRETCTVKQLHPTRAPWAVGWIRKWKSTQQEQLLRFNSGGALGTKGRKSSPAQPRPIQEWYYQPDLSLSLESRLLYLKTFSHISFFLSFLSSSPSPCQCQCQCHDADAMIPTPTLTFHGNSFGLFVLHTVF